MATITLRLEKTTQELLGAAKSLRKVVRELESVIENMSKPIEIDLTDKQIQQIEQSIKELSKKGLL